MFDLLATVLSWFYDIWPSYGIAIMFLTLSVMLILTPLTLKGTRSMMMLQQLQPEMKKLQQRHKDDRQKLNEEMLKFYRENKINPLGGCLPLLIQLPVFFVLYRVLSQLTKVGPDGTFDPSYLDEESALFKALDSARAMVSWSIDLSHSATKEISEAGFVSALPFLVLIFGVAATSYVQQKQVSGRNPNSQMNPQQQMLLRIMPAFFAFISLTLPAALVVYFFVSNLYRVGQQALISHTIYKPALADGTITATAKEGPRSGGDTGAPGRAEGGKAALTSGSDSAQDAPKGFFARLIGGAGAEQSAPGAKATGAKARSNGSRGQSGTTGSTGKGQASKPGTGTGAAKARSGGNGKAPGRATPPGARPRASSRGGSRGGSRASNARKKRKRK